MLKNVLKFGGLGLLIVFLGVAAISGIQYLKYRFSPEYQQYREAVKMLEAYNNDPYGGDTPEETLKLFIGALKNGDTDLAAKYFVLHKQEEWKGKLKIAKDNNHLNLYIDEVNQAKSGKEIYPGTYLFTIIENGKSTLSISLEQVEKSKKWKIESL